MDRLANETKKRFSFAWSKFARKEVENKWNKDSLSYIKSIPEDIFKGEKIGLDVGCGSGADMSYISQYGAKVIGVDFSDSLCNTHDNIKKLKDVFVVQADVYNLPFQDDKFDFVYSFGVLHHLIAPEEGFRRLVSKTKKGGFIIIYIYEDFSERSTVERFLLKIVNSSRVITTRIPLKLLYFFSIMFSPFIFLFCSIPYQILRKIKFMPRITEKIPYRHTTNLECIVADLYDRFSVPIEKRYKKEEVRDWFERAKLQDFHIVNHRGWVAWGKKR